MRYGYRLHAEALKDARESAGLTVADLAAMAGVDPYQLARVEQNRYAPPITTVRMIAFALGIPAHTVIEWPKPRPGPHVFYEMPELDAIPEYEPPEYPA